jgi:hypothetical protein
MSHSESQTSSKLRLFLPRLLALRKSYTAEEVRKRLRVDAACADARTQAVHAAAAMTGVWASLLTDRVAFDLGRAANRLPTVVFWYCQGLCLHEIGRRLSPFGTRWDAERAVDAAAELIAQALNSGEITQLVA